LPPDGPAAGRRAAAARAELIRVRLAIWFVLLFAVAVVAAATFGTNDGLASFYWGSWRLDLSLNLFVLLLVGTCFLLVAVIQAFNSLISLPKRAREWRTAQARSHRPGRAARGARAVLRRPLHARTEVGPARARDPGRDARARAGQRVHRPRPPARRGQRAPGPEPRPARRGAPRALDLAHRSPAARSAEEGARLLAAEWALDDRDAPRAIELLNALPLGVARRTHALRLKLQAARLGRLPQEALKTARLLIKHQGFSAVAAAGLVRSLAFESLETVHDIDQLRRLWLSFDPADRRDPFIAARAAMQASALGANDDARAVVAAALGPDRRARQRGPRCARRGARRVGLGHRCRMAAAPRVGGAGAAARRRDRARRRKRARRARAVGQGESAARAGRGRRRLAPAARRKAWIALAELAAQDGDAARAAHCYESAARQA
jgi:HemY protein